MLTGLGYAARFFNPIQRSLQRRNPDTIPLNTAEAYSFLRECAPHLQQAGFGLLVPPWWNKPGMRLGYTGLVDPTMTVGLGKGEVYMVDIMDRASERALANQGALGMYCNSLMVTKALYDRLPEKPPAPLEDIIDSSIKTGADLSQVIAWNYQNSREILESGVPMPEILHDRLSYDREDPPPWPVASQDHWLDKTVRGVTEHIAHIEARRGQLAQITMPPQEVFSSVTSDLEAVRTGAGLNRVYVGTIRRLARARPFGIPTPEDFDAARQAAEDYLNRYPPTRHSIILRGAIASVYAGDTPASDAAIWVPSAKQVDDRLPGIAQRSLIALRDIGILDEIDESINGVIVYPNASPTGPKFKTEDVNDV